MLAALKGNGIDATALGNPITGTLVATSGSTAGNALDQSLDTLNAKLASSGVTLAQLTTTLLQNRPAATPSGTPSVALEVALQPKAATCDAFRAGGGELMLMAAGEDGTWASATHVRTHTLPAVGTVGATWKLGAVKLLTDTVYGPTAQSISESGNTITSVDAVNKLTTRNAIVNFTGPVTRPETLYINAVAGNTRPGYGWRRPDVGVSTRDGAIVNVSEFVTLSLRGTGMTAVVLPGTTPLGSSFVVSVAKP